MLMVQLLADKPSARAVSTLLPPAEGAARAANQH